MALCSRFTCWFVTVVTTVLDDTVIFCDTRSGFQNGSLSLAQLPDKVIITVGEGIPSLSYDLFEAKAIEKKTELQLILFRLADKVTELTQELKASSDSLERLKAQKEGAPGGLSTFDNHAKKTTQAAPVKRKQGHSLINPGSRKLKPAKGVQFD